MKYNEHIIDENLFDLAGKALVCQPVGLPAYTLYYGT